MWLTTYSKSGTDGCIVTGDTGGCAGEVKRGERGDSWTRFVNL